MMAIVGAVASIICVGILGICSILGSYAICEAFDSKAEVDEK